MGQSIMISEEQPESDVILPKFKNKMGTVLSQQDIKLESKPGQNMPILIKVMNKAQLQWPC